jgi:hypothetical protein
MRENAALYVCGGVHNAGPGEPMNTTRIAVLLALLIAGVGRPALAQTATFSRIDTAVQLSLQGRVTVGDFDRDGFPDLVLETHSLTEAFGLHFLRGLGDGTFGPPSQVFSGCCSSSGAGDVNGDDKLDVVFVEGEGVGVLPGRGDGTFGSLIRTSTRAFSPRPPLILDFNRDAKLDLALSDQAGGISVLLGHGDGTFGTAVNFPITGGSFANSLVGGDFNGDGILDIAASNPGPPNFFGTNVSVLLGKGDGTFGSPTDFPVGVTPYPMATADFNADHKLDIAVANYHSFSVSVLLGHGDGTFAPQLETPDGPFPVGLGAADFNGDGKPDLASGGAATSLAILLGHGDGTVGPVNEVAALTSTQGLAVADFDRDGKPDVVIVYLSPANAFSIFLNTTASDITPPVVTASASPSSLWPPNGRLAAVTLTGTITDTGSGVDASSATFQVADEYGLVQPSGPVDVDADGSYRVQVLLPATRQGWDVDGRTFSLRVSATDKAGNPGSGTALVTVSHDRGHAAGPR